MVWGLGGSFLLGVQRVELVGVVRVQLLLFAITLPVQQTASASFIAQNNSFPYYNID